MWGGLFSCREGKRGLSLRRCGAGIGPALRGRGVGTFPGDAEWEQGGVPEGLCSGDEGVVGCAQREEGAAAGEFRMRQMGVQLLFSAAVGRQVSYLPQVWEQQEYQGRDFRERAHDMGQAQCCSSK